MNKILLALSVSLICLSSCSKEAPKPLTQQEIQESIDSLTRERIRQVDKLAKIELEYRMKIEVKVKVDSILQARSQQQPADTAAKVN